MLVASGRRAASHLSCDLEHSRKRDRRSADGTRIEALRAPRHGCEKGLEVWSRKGGLCTLPKMLNANSMFFVQFYKTVWDFTVHFKVTLKSAATDAQARILAGHEEKSGHSTKSRMGDNPMNTQLCQYRYRTKLPVS